MTSALLQSFAVALLTCIPSSLAFVPQLHSGAVVRSSLTCRWAESENLHSLTVPLLKDKLKDLGLKVSGTKTELIQRIEDNVAGVSQSSSSLGDDDLSSNVEDPADFVASSSYSRDPYDTSVGTPLPIAPAALNELLATREVARNAKDYETSDVLREELRSHGVDVDDKALTWRGDFKDRRETGHHFRRRREDDAALSEAALEAVDNILAARAKAKNQFRFDEADTLRDQLRIDHHVFVDDKAKTWGVGRAEGRDARGAAKSETTGKDYRRASNDATTLPPGVAEQVVALLDERCAARYDRDYAKADIVKDDLLSKFGVVVQDRTLEWRADGGGFGVRKAGYGSSGHDYARSPEDGTGDRGLVPGGLSEFDVDALLAQRLDAKIRRDFVLADAIRDDLTAAGVAVEDKLKLWRADGVPFAGRSWSDDRGDRGGGDRGGGDRGGGDRRGRSREGGYSGGTRVFGAE